MKLNVFRKIAGLACGLVLGATVQAQTLNSSEEYVLGLAAQLYPDLFESHGAIKSAQGYTYLTFTSGVSVGFKDGSLFVSGGPFGAGIQNKGSVSQVTTQLTNLKNSVSLTPTSDMNSLFALAAQAYPTLFTTGTSFQTSADGYLYRYFDSGLYVGIKNGVVYVKGGTYGKSYTSLGNLNTLLTRLQTAVNGSTGGGTTIPQGNYNLTVSGSFSLSGPVAITQPFSFTLNGTPAPSLSDQDAIKKAFTDSLGASGNGITITNFSFTPKSNTANLVEFDVSVAATINQGGFTTSYTYALNYKYTK